MMNQAEPAAPSLAQTMLVQRALLVLSLEDFNDIHRRLGIITQAARLTCKHLVVVLFCAQLDRIENIDINENRLSRTGAWVAVQTALSLVYVETMRVAQDMDRILMDVDVLLKGTNEEVRIGANSEAGMGLDCVFCVVGDRTDYALPSWILSLPRSQLSADDPPVAIFSQENAMSVKSVRDPENGWVRGAEHLSELPPKFPVVVLGGTFDHLHNGHKILLSMAAWIACEKVIVGVTDDKLLDKKAYKEALEPLDTRMRRVERFLTFFRPDLRYEVVPIEDVYGPTAVDPNIQALVVSRETLGGAEAIATKRKEKGLGELVVFIIDVISTTSMNLPAEDVEMLRKGKMSSTYIREWIMRRRCVGTCTSTSGDSSV